MSDAPADTSRQWATIADVKELTRVEVDETTRLQAVASIENLVGVLEEGPRGGISDRDLVWLKRAVCYQAAWLEAQPDFFERNDVSSASQSGQSATGANRDWLILSPNARRCLKRLSWRGPRTIATGAQLGKGDKPDLDTLDDRLPWRPL